MRAPMHGPTTAMLLGALAVWPCVASAQTTSEADFDEAASVIDETSEWILDDGVTPAEVPWNDFDPAEAYDPHGTVHGGVALRLAFIAPGGAVPGGPLIEMSGTLDVRYRWNSPFGIRIGIGLSYQDYVAEELGGGTFVSTSPGALRFRVLPLSVDLGRYVALRAGFNLGAQWVPMPNGGHAAFTTGGSGEAVVKLFGGTVELGIVGGVQLTALTTVSRCTYYCSDGDGMQAQAFVGGTMGYVFP